MRRQQAQTNRAQHNSSVLQPAEKKAHWKRTKLIKSAVRNSANQMSDWCSNYNGSVKALHFV